MLANWLTGLSETGRNFVSFLFSFFLFFFFYSRSPSRSSSIYHSRAHMTRSIKRFLFTRAKRPFYSCRRCRVHVRLRASLLLKDRGDHVSRMAAKTPTSLLCLNKVTYFYGMILKSGEAKVSQHLPTHLSWRPRSCRRCLFSGCHRSAWCWAARCGSY